MAEPSTDALVAGTLAGDRRQLARLISAVEDGMPVGLEAVAALMPHTGRALTIGVTGPPGVGKSTLVSGLVAAARGVGRTVGVVAVDPSSSFTSGAVLGDRIRLADHFVDEGVFIRSMATRGHAGGLAAATLQTCLVLDASGMDVIFVETVGAGQTEIEVRSIVDLVALVLMPDSGDSIQGLKAGIMEIPDLVVLNKRDLDGAEAALRDLRLVTGLADDDRLPILATAAVNGDGVSMVWETLVKQHEQLTVSGELGERRRRNLGRETLALAELEVRRALESIVREDDAMREVIRSVERRELDPASAATAIVTQLLGAR